MKVTIIAFNNLNKSPYVNIYADFCHENGIDYEIVYPNRDGVAEKTRCPLFAVPWDSAKHKLINFLSFRKKTIRHLKQSNSDFVVVLTTMPAVLLSGFLSRRYKGRYLVDIRDYTYEHIRPYFWLEKHVLTHSAMNVISSPGFRRFLPKKDYVLCQNIQSSYRNGQGETFNKTSDPIIIGYVGTIAYKDQCRKLMKLVEADERFCFYFYGNESGNTTLTDEINRLGCDRIRAFGAYQPSDKVRIMKSVDILFNAYGNGNKLLDYALSNKLYDAYYMHIPLLTSPNTAMSEEAGAFSFDIDLNSATSLNTLYNWYKQIDATAFNTASTAYLQRVFALQDDFYTSLRAVLKQENKMQ